MNKKGFTLVELVIVITVIGILAAVLIPTFSVVINSANLTAAEEEATSLRVGIMVEYKSGTFDDYCKDNKTEKGTPKMLTDFIMKDGKEGEGAKFGDYVSELKEDKIEINADGYISYTTKSGYKVKLTAKDVEVTKE